MLLLPKLHNCRKCLAVPHHVYVTLDILTERRMHSFMAITVHTFSGCKANAFLLSLEAFKGSHTGGSDLLKSMRRLYWSTVLLVKSTFVKLTMHRTCAQHSMSLPVSMMRKPVWQLNALQRASYTVTLYQYDGILTSIKSWS